jgi:hypothetical protein
MKKLVSFSKPGSQEEEISAVQALKEALVGRPTLIPDSKFLMHLLNVWYRQRKAGSAVRKSFRGLRTALGVPSLQQKLSGEVLFKQTAEVEKVLQYILSNWEDGRGDGLPAIQQHVSSLRSSGDFNAVTSSLAKQIIESLPSKPLRPQIDWVKVTKVNLGTESSILSLIDPLGFIPNEIECVVLQCRASSVGGGYIVTCEINGLEVTLGH